MNRFNNSARDRRDERDAEEWKAELFVNIYLPIKRADGTVGKYKLGKNGLAITSKGSDAKLVDLYKKDAEAFQKMLAEKIIIDVQSAAGGPAVEFAF